MNFGETPYRRAGNAVAAIVMAYPGYLSERLGELIAMMDKHRAPAFARPVIGAIVGNELSRWIDEEDAAEPALRILAEAWIEPEVDRNMLRRYAAAAYVEFTEMRREAKKGS